MPRSPKPFCPNCEGSGTMLSTYAGPLRCACTLDDREFDRAIEDILGRGHGSPGVPDGRGPRER